MDIQGRYLQEYDQHPTVISISRVSGTFQQAAHGPHDFSEKWGFIKAVPRGLNPQNAQVHGETVTWKGDQEKPLP